MYLTVLVHSVVFLQPPHFNRFATMDIPYDRVNLTPVISGRPTDKAFYWSGIFSFVLWLTALSFGILLVVQAYNGNWDTRLNYKTPFLDQHCTVDDDDYVCQYSDLLGKGQSIKYGEIAGWTLIALTVASVVVFMATYLAFAAGMARDHINESNTYYASNREWFKVLVDKYNPIMVGVRILEGERYTGVAVLGNLYAFFIEGIFAFLLIFGFGVRDIHAATWWGVLHMVRVALVFVSQLVNRIPHARDNTLASMAAAVRIDWTPVTLQALLGMYLAAEWLVFIFKFPSDARSGHKMAVGLLFVITLVYHSLYEVFRYATRDEVYGKWILDAGEAAAQSVEMNQPSCSTSPIACNKNDGDWRCWLMGGLSGASCAALTGGSWLLSVLIPRRKESELAPGIIFRTVFGVVVRTMFQMLQLFLLIWIPWWAGESVRYYSQIRFQ